MDLYQSILSPALFSGFKADPEQIHSYLMQTLHRAFPADDTKSPAVDLLARALLRSLQATLCVRDERLAQTLWNLPFANPVGLAAGFDKDGLAAGAWSAFGFGFAELGTVTLHAQPGNPKPRLFRLPKDEAALNRMGFNNRGAAAMAAWLVEIREQATGQAEQIGSGGGQNLTSSSQIQKPRSFMPLGINLGKSKITALEEAAEDYVGSFRLLKNLGDYFVVNVSSPNTPGLRSLQDADQLDHILSRLQQENAEQKPLLVKIAPDLEWGAIADILSLSQTHGLAGIIATNTTIRRDGLRTQTLAATGNLVAQEAGGISGAPLRQRSTEVIRFIYQKTEGKLPIIGVGGIFTAQDAWEKITAGASLVQVYTGWIYEGPWMVRRILEGLVQKLEAEGMSTISDAVGTASNGG